MRFLPLLLVFLAACTPPPVNGDSGDQAHSDVQRIPGGESLGAAAAPAGFLVFATQTELFADHVDLAFGPFAQGVATWESKTQEELLTPAQRKFLNRLRELVRSEIRVEDRGTKRHVRAAEVHLEPKDDGSIEVQVVEWVVGPGGRTGREMRSGWIDMRPGQKPTLHWVDLTPG